MLVSGEFPIGVLRSSQPLSDPSLCSLIRPTSNYAAVHADGQGVGVNWGVFSVSLLKKPLTFAGKIGLITPLGQIAQLVEQRTENPCVPGSIPGLAKFLLFPQAAGRR